MVTWHPGFAHLWCKMATDIMGYHGPQKNDEEMGDTKDRILEHCPKICKLNGEDTYFRVVLFYQLLGCISHCCNYI
jgi:hypothetical protein